MIIGSLLSVDCYDATNLTTPNLVSVASGAGNGPLPVWLNQLQPQLDLNQALGPMVELSPNLIPYHLIPSGHVQGIAMAGWKGRNHLALEKILNWAVASYFWVALCRFPKAPTVSDRRAVD